MLQMSGWAGAQNLHAESGKAIQYSGMTDCFRRTVQEEGYRALFKVPLPPLHHSANAELPQCRSMLHAALTYYTVVRSVACSNHHAYVYVACHAIMLTYPQISSKDN